eukprot:s1783_g11.t1
MDKYRQILLEPTLARAISKSWRKPLVRGLDMVAAPLQQGGRKGLGIEPLHLMVRMWQSNAKANKMSLGLLFVDVKSAFYSIVKPMLAKYDGSGESVAKIFQELSLPPSAFQQFLVNVGDSSMIERATGSEIVASQVAANLSHTWFLIPNGTDVRAPKTGSRPGDPCADILFGFVMAQMLDQICTRAANQGISLRPSVDSGTMTAYVGWVDDLALSVTAEATEVVRKTVQLTSIVLDVMIEHGMQLSCGKGKTAILFEFHGKGSTKAKQQCERDAGDGLWVMSEHQGAMLVPILGHYKHLGGIIVPGGAKLHEVRARGAAMRQNVAPLKTLLANDRFALHHRRMLLRSVGVSVIKLHCGTWFDLNQSEIEAWHAVVFNTYHLLEGRQHDGSIAHKEMYEIASQMRAPMPVELLYIERIRLLIHMIQIHDRFVIAAVLYKYQVTGKSSWLYGAIKSLQWAQTQVGKECVPDELFALNSWDTWHDFREVGHDLRKMLKKVEKAHQIRLRTYCAVKEQADFQTQIFQDMGWTKASAIPEPPQDHVSCPECAETFASQAALAVHQQRRHHHRIALRRVVTDGVGRGCGKQFHSRTRLLGHLHWGKGACWSFHLRQFSPMDEELTAQWDLQDRETGQACHQRGWLEDHARKSWRWATEAELQPHLPVKVFNGDIWASPSDSELREWANLGMLPPGRGGREQMQRQVADWEVSNVCRDTSRFEEDLKQEAHNWTPNFDYVARPLSSAQLHFLILFSGHRRWGDISSWYHWDGRVMPIAVDLAVDGEHGNVLCYEPWLSLIRAQRVVGAHGGPPCETYSVARWREIPGQPCPQPLRDQQFPWGRLYLSLKEVFQCHTGTELMLLTMRILLEVYAAGGSISLEHPRGDVESSERWCVWLSSFVRWMLVSADIQTCTFLQGPLGQVSPKPTTMLIGRLATFPGRIYRNYSKYWRPAMVLEGKDSQGWRTAQAKVYPPLLSRIIFEAHMDHYLTISRAETGAIPEDVISKINALTKIHDPYDTEGFQEMQGDFHGGRSFHF